MFVTRACSWLPPIHALVVSLSVWQTRYEESKGTEHTCVVEDLDTAKQDIYHCYRCNRYDSKHIRPFNWYTK